MEIIGVIAEYNPFHNGHAYHLNKIKKLYKDSIIIGVISSSFTQRGDVSLLNKWDKTKIALDMGIDIIIELPYIFSTQSADIFAKGALKLLNELKVNKIIFGSEFNDIKELYEIAKKTTNNKEYEKKVKECIDKGLNYPTANFQAVKEITGKTINTPNDILGLCYIKEILKNKYNIEAISIKRTNDYNSSLTTGKISSATSIRENLKNNKEINKYVPKAVPNMLYNKNVIDTNYFNLLKYKIVSEKDLSIYQTVDEGIENKIKKEINNCNSLEELINVVKTKRYTNNKLRRMFTHILTNFTKEDAKKKTNIEYIRILGFSNNGKNYLNKIKKEINLPLITNYTNSLDFEKQITNIYSLLVNDNLLNELEYKNKPVIK